MFQYIWPLAVIVLSNVVYQICAKSIPPKMNAYASITVTYAIATLFSAAAFFLSAKDKNIFKKFSHVNWATLVLGIVITGLEVGFIFAYKAGWKVSVLATVANGLLAIALVFVALFLYNEAISWTKICGLALCVAGLWFINK